MNNTERPVRIPDIKARKNRGEKIVMLTAYDAWMARLLAACGTVDMLLVGDSLGMVELGYDTTVPVTMNDIVRHTRAVRAGAPQALIVADMPFLSHRISRAASLRNAGRLMQQGGATAVKVEGGLSIAETVERIVAAGIPVMGHLGLQPQSVHALGGFRRQFTRPEEQQQLMEDAAALEKAGVFAIVLECVPDELAEVVTAALRVPVIGIGSGPHCDGQVLVTHDILGLSGPQAPPFARQYAQLGEEIRAAVKSFADDVRSGAFPNVRSRQPLHV
jgi:3-methyl-2-oxobutanoate hydroxymethyltransferase